MTQPLNPILYAALKRRFGTVKISSVGVPMKWRVEYDTFGRRHLDVYQGGEQYSVCCPLCGDTKYRLWIGHSWLTIPSKEFPRLTHNIRCETGRGCQVYREEFYRQFLDDIGTPSGAAEMFAQLAPQVEIPPLRLPLGCVPLQSLQADHKACQFLNVKYNGLTPEYLGKVYGALFTEQHDELYPKARNRVIFPILVDGQLAGWQGRAIDGSEPKWMFNPHFRKCFYNGDNVHESQIPIICEGITNAIACGPNGIAIFGKDLDDERCVAFAKKWRTAIIAIDPETTIPDPRDERKRVFALEMKKKLDQYLKVPAHILQWPEEVLAIARQKFADPKNKKISVPDAADLGMIRMRALLDQVPFTHRGIA
jgi:hypothetical protein